MKFLKIINSNFYENGQLKVGENLLCNYERHYYENGRVKYETTESGTAYKYSRHGCTIWYKNKYGDEYESKYGNYGIKIKEFTKIMNKKVYTLNELKEFINKKKDDIFVNNEVGTLLEQFARKRLKRKLGTVAYTSVLCKNTILCPTDDDYFDAYELLDKTRNCKTYGEIKTFI
jgi:hypothetical protein